MESKVTYKNQKFLMRTTKLSDKDDYYAAMNNLDEEVAYLTDSQVSYEKEVVDKYFINNLTDKSRYDFLIFEDDEILGEVVLNEIDEELKSAHFRICVFSSKNFNRGIGSFAMENILDFAFNKIKLHKVALEVFSFNPRAIKVYENHGFKREGVLRDAVMDKDKYADIICMGILEDEYSEKTAKLG